MVKLKTIIYQLPEFEILRKVLYQEGKIKLRGVYGSLLSLVVNYVREIHEKPQLVVVADTDAAEQLVDDLQNFAPADQVRYFPSDEAVPFDKGVFTPILYSMRMNALTVAVEKASPIIVTTPAAILKKVPPPETVFE